MQTTSKIKQTLRANLFKVSNYYLLGSRKCNIIHTRLRHQCSSPVKLSEPNNKFSIEITVYSVILIINCILAFV
jgi:hypothetical protein